MKLRLRSAILVTSALALFGASSASAQTAAPPAAAEQDPASSRTGPISGYMDFHFNKVEGEDGVLDFHRFVLLFNHSFSSRIRFVGELELEHAFVEGLEEAGELELEQAYLDFLLSRRVQRPRRDDAGAGRASSTSVTSRRSSTASSGPSSTP